MGIAVRRENTTWVTQFDACDELPDGMVQGAPTSSSTLPGLVVRMLEDLDLHDGHTVLEIGTGTGYSTALLCERLGDDLVTSIEVDEGIAARAAAALMAVGYTPTLITGDGLAGYPQGAPYDRIIATCSVRTIPPAWIAQARPGGRILVTLSGWLYGSGLVAVEVTADGTAEGRYLPGTVSFMPARDGRLRTAVYGADILDDWMGRFLAELAAPGAQRARLLGDAETPSADLLIDQTTGAYAWLTEESDGTWSVQQGGPARLWDQVEHTQDIWRRAGRPPQHAFTVHITPTAQTVRLRTPEGPHSWTLPTAG